MQFSRRRWITWNQTGCKVLWSIVVIDSDYPWNRDCFCMSWYWFEQVVPLSSVLGIACLHEDVMFYDNVMSLKFLKPLFYSIFLNATKIDQVGLGDKFEWQWVHIGTGWGGMTLGFHTILSYQNRFWCFICLEWDEKVSSQICVFW